VVEPFINPLANESSASVKILPRSIMMTNLKFDSCYVTFKKSYSNLLHNINHFEFYFR
jgi:hypothetical protein